MIYLIFIIILFLSLFFILYIIKEKCIIIKSTEIAILKDVSLIDNKTINLIPDIEEFYNCYKVSIIKHEKYILQILISIEYTLDITTIIIDGDLEWIY
jgi:hypothetical protein